MRGQTGVQIYDVTKVLVGLRLGWCLGFAFLIVCSRIFCIPMIHQNRLYHMKQAKEDNVRRELDSNQRPSDPRERIIGS
jgi:hypothetical protein